MDGIQEEVIESVPNSLMIRFLSVFPSGGNADLDELEQEIAIAVGIENGWMNEDLSLTDKGKSFCVREFIALEINKEPERNHQLLDAAITQIRQGGMNLEDFEKKHKIPARSAKLVLRIAEEMNGLR